MTGVLETNLFKLERRARIMVRRLMLAQTHVRAGTEDGRDWKKRRDYLIAWVDIALCDLHREFAGWREAAANN
jgi:hypothetical protein